MADAPTALSASSERLKKLIADLKAPVPQVSQKAAEELGNLGDEQAVEPLCAALNPADWQLAVAVADALGKLKSRQAIAPLVEMLAISI
jgi:HEAT repeat protein